MQKLMQIHVNFLCRQNRLNKRGESPIVLRIVYRHERRDLYTGLYTRFEDWDTQNGIMKTSLKKGHSFNKNLDMIRYRAIEVFEKLKFTGVPFTMDELARKIKGDEEKPTTLAEYLDGRREEIKQRVYIDITPTTFEKYERVLRFVLDFLQVEYKMRNFPLVQIDNRMIIGNKPAQLLVDKYFKSK